MDYTYILASNLFGLKKFSQNLSGLLSSTVFGPLLDWDLGQFLIIGLGISPKMVRTQKIEKLFENILPSSMLSAIWHKYK